MPSSPGGVVLAAVLAAVSILLLVIGLADWEWRTAIGRALLGNAPYTRLTVKPGDVVVDRDGEVTVAIAVEGRVPDRVALQFRPTTPAEKAAARPTDWRSERPMFKTAMRRPRGRCSRRNSRN